MNRNKFFSRLMVAVVFFTSVLSSYEVQAQADSLILIRLDSLMKLSQLQIKLLKPTDSDEYKALKKDLDFVKLEKDGLVKEKSKCEKSLSDQASLNKTFINGFADNRMSNSTISVITDWSKVQKIDMASLNQTIEISKKLDEIDLALTKAPDAKTLKSILDNRDYLLQIKSKMNQKSALFLEVDKYCLMIQHYITCLKEFEKLCDGISVSIVKSTITDIMSVYKYDIAKFPFLRGAFYYAVDYPESKIYRLDFLWFLDNNVQFPAN